MRLSSFVGISCGSNMLVADTDSQALEWWYVLCILSSPNLIYKTLGLQAATCLTRLNAEGQAPTTAHVAHS